MGAAAPFNAEAGAGDAGIVLNLLLLASEGAVPGTVLVELGGGRVVVLRGVPEAADSRFAVVLGLSAVLVEPTRVDRGSFSAAVAPPVVERRSEVDVGLDAVGFVVKDGASETRLAVPEAIGLLFSVPGLAGAFFESSIELVDGRDT